MELVLAILLAILAIGLFIYSIFLFQEKGPIPTTLYILAKAKERKKMRTKEEYRFTGIVMLTISINFLLTTIGIVFRISLISKIVILVWVILVAYVLVYSIWEVIKR